MNCQTRRKTDDERIVVSNKCFGCDNFQTEATHEINKKFFHNFGCFMLFAKKQKIEELISCLKIFLQKKEKKDDEVL